MLKWMGADGPDRCGGGDGTRLCGGRRRRQQGSKDKAYTAAPGSMKARITTGAVTALWHDISIYRASDPRRLAGPTYEVASYGTRAECDAAQQGGGGQSGVITDGSDNRSAEDDSDVMCLPVIDERDAEIAGEGDAFDLH
jgi:hypothetical protein